MPLISNITICSIYQAPGSQKLSKREKAKETDTSGRLKMGNHYHQEQQHQHPAMESLANLLSKANHDLNMVQFKLEREFQQTYPDSTNPMKLVNRVKKIQDDLTTLKEQCRELLAAKQDLIDKAQTTLVGNWNLLRRMQTSMGVPLASADEDTSFANFNQIVDEWTSQVIARTGDDSCDSGSNGINKLLFSAITE